MTKKAEAAWPKELIEAEDILDEYKKPHSQVDIGNVYFAACTFRDEVIRLEALLDSAVREARATAMAQAFEIAAVVERPYTIEAYRSRLRLLASEQRDAANQARASSAPNITEKVTNDAIGEYQED